MHFPDGEVGYAVDLDGELDVLSQARKHGPKSEPEFWSAAAPGTTCDDCGSADNVEERPATNSQGNLCTIHRCHDCMAH